MMKYFYSIMIVIAFLSSAYGQNNKDIKLNEHLTPNEIRSAINAAENEADYEEIAKYLSSDAIYIASQGPPFCGREAIKSLFKFFFANNEFSSEYISEKLTFNNNTAVDEGTYISINIPRNGGKKIVDTVKYKWECVKSEDSWNLTRMFYGETNSPESQVPHLPSATGKYSVGRRDFVFTDESREEIFTEDKNDFREVAFQIWYPGIPGKNQEFSEYQSRDVAEASAKFLGWPLFFNSYFQLVKTNSYLNVNVADNEEPFPVILYNHGYGGFTSVHQVLFEELASHGFIVVSVGHAFESALFILPGGGVKSFEPQNAAYSSRNSESHSTLIEEIKDNIIRAEFLPDKNKYFKELIRESKLNNESTRIWTEDNIFVLSKLEEMNLTDELFEGKLNLEQVGAIGHSLGGATAGQLVLKEPRVKAGINLDGFQFGDLLGNHLQKPFMFMGEWRNVNDIFFHSSESDCYLVSVQGFEHSTFTDLPIFASVWESSQLDSSGLRALEIQKVFILSFFNKHLMNLKTPLLDGPSEKYPEVRFESNITVNN